MGGFDIFVPCPIRDFRKHFRTIILSFENTSSNKLSNPICRNYKVNSTFKSYASYYYAEQKFVSLRNLPFNFEELHFEA